MFVFSLFITKLSKFLYLYDNRNYADYFYLYNVAPIFEVFYLYCLFYNEFNVNRAMTESMDYVIGVSDLNLNE